MVFRRPKSTSVATRTQSSESPRPIAGRHLVDIEVEAAHAGDVTVMVDASRSLYAHVDAPGRFVLSVVCEGPLGDVRVDSPHVVLSAQPRRSEQDLPWTSSLSRPWEEADVVDAVSRSVIRLGQGWAPRELVDEKPVRWLGSTATVDIDASGGGSRFSLRGIAGPSLGRGASMVVSAGGLEIQRTELEMEDGQAFSVEVDLPDSFSTGTLHFFVDRLSPRFTPHDVRTLNLLVHEVRLR